jgi:hypothetical protein
LARPDFYFETIQPQSIGRNSHRQFLEYPRRIALQCLARGRFGSDRWEADWMAAHPLENNPFTNQTQAA